MFYQNIRTTALLLLLPLAIHAQTYVEGIKSIDREQYRTAQQYFRGQEKSDTKNASIHRYFQGLCLVYLNQQDSAKAIFKQGMTDDPSNAYFFAGMGMAVMKDNQVEGEQNLAKATELAKKNAYIMNEIARGYLQFGRKEKADQVLALMAIAIKADPKNYWSQIYQGDAYDKKNNANEAINSYNQAKYSDPSNPLAYYKAGRIYYYSKNYDAALKQYEEGKTKDPNFAPFYREIGELYKMASRNKQAVESYKRYIELADKNDQTAFRYAAFMFLNNDYAGAIPVLEELRAKKFNEPALYRLLAVSYFETAKYNEGLQESNYFFSNYGNQALAIDYKYQGKLLVKTGKPTEAQTSIEKAVSMDSTAAEAYWDLGLYSFDQKKYLEAGNFFLKKINYTKGDINEWLATGKAFLYGDQFKTADSCFAKVTELNPNAYNGPFWQARANDRLDPEPKKWLAKPYYEKVAALCETDTQKFKTPLIEAYEYLGYHYLSTKDTTKANEYWNKILVLDPANAKAKAGLK
jgi:tetratricopeptide (TPR) repeat protein